MAMKDAELEASYVSAFGRSLPFGKSPALLIVDFTQAYLDPASPLYAAAEQALASAVRLRSSARAGGVPVIFTTVEYAPGGTDGGVFYRKIPALQSFEKGNPLAAFPPSLEPQPDELVIVKKYASAFFGTSLASTLVSQNIDTLLITGVSTSGCIRATTVDACQHGFLPFVVRDACGDRHPAPHEASLFDLQAKYAEVIGEAEAMQYLERD